MFTCRIGKCVLKQLNVNGFFMNKCKVQIPPDNLSGAQILHYQHISSAVFPKMTDINEPSHSPFDSFKVPLNKWRRNYFLLLNLEFSLRPFGTASVYSSCRKVCSVAALMCCVLTVWTGYSLSSSVCVTNKGTAYVTSAFPRC